MQNNSTNQCDHALPATTAPVVNDLRPVMTGLSPAFRESTTGEVHLSRERDGKLSEDHSFFHLPLHWISKTAKNGEAMVLIPTIEAGYWRSTGFIAITKIIRLPLDS